MTTSTRAHRPSGTAGLARDGSLHPNERANRSHQRRRGVSGWVPQQHGAWAILVVPWMVGLVLAHRADTLEAGRLLLGPAWALGYLAFNAATLMTKAAPVKRPRYRRPLLTYAVLAAALGLAAVVTAPAVLWWAPVGIVLVAAVLWLTRHKRERSLVAGVLSIIAGTGIAVVTRFWSPAQVSTASAPELATLALTIGYFIGTVLVVKTMIRERGSRGWVLASVGYHAIVCAASVLALAMGWLGWPWVLLGVACLARAIAEPRLLQRVSVLQIGLVEVVLSALVVIAAVSG